MKSKQLNFAVLLFVLCCALFQSARAAELGGGILVQLTSTEPLAQMPAGVTAVCDDAGIYLAENLDAVDELAQIADIAYTEENILLELYGTPTDSHYSKQWDLPDIGIQAAWDNGATGRGVRIGIVDSGINFAHEDFVGAHIEPGYDYLDSDADPTDTTGHGTFIAGTIAAQKNNGVGIVGIAPEATIVPLRCFSGKTAPLDVIVKAIRGAIDDYHCQIINLSLGTTQDVATLRAVIDYAQRKGVVVVAAAGNSGTASTVKDPIFYPAGYDSVISVGATDSQRKLGYFSQKNSKAFVVAPGVKMPGPWFTGKNVYNVGDGTSYAAPIVTAIVALMWENYPGLTQQELKATLQQTAIDLGKSGWDSSFGYGLVRIPEVFAALEKPAISAVRTDTGATITLCSGQLPPGRSVTAYVAAYDSGGKLCGIAQQIEAVPPSGRLTLREMALIAEKNFTKLKAFFLDSATTAPLTEQFSAQIE